MQTVSRLGSNLKAFLSPSKGKQNVSSGAGDRGMSSDNTQQILLTLTHVTYVIFTTFSLMMELLIFIKSA